MDRLFKGERSVTSHVKLCDHIHNRILQVIAKRQPEEVKSLVEQDILEVKEKLKGFIEGDKGD